MERFIVSDPAYYQNSVKPRNFEEWAAMYDVADHGPLGLWQFEERDERTGLILARQWIKNIITDNGGKTALSVWGSAAPTLYLNQIVMTTNGASTTLTSALVSGTGYSSLSVATMASIPATGSTVTVGFGTAQTQIWTVASGSTSTTLNVTTQNANANYGIGASVVPNPNVTDPSSLSGTVYYSGALSSGAFTYANSGGSSGTGNRSVTIVVTFAASGPLAGLYTEALTVGGATPITTNTQTGSHLYMQPLTINNVTSQTVTIVEKL